MECNRDEAVHARTVAEQKLAIQDYVGAKKFAMKAHQLFPSLESMVHMMAVIDVHIAALMNIGTSNEKDWYGILQVEPSADEVALKKQYRKLALLLHPDKNKWVGAESAFKLIGEAWQVLSDKTRRLVHDAKRGMQKKANNRERARKSRGAGMKAQHNQRHPNVATFPNLFNHANQGQNFPMHPNFAATKPQPQNLFNHRNQGQDFPMHPNFAATKPQPQLHPFTFWTACASCQMRYEYLRKYENQNLVCPKCHIPFIAINLSKLQQVHVKQVPPPNVGGQHNGVTGLKASTDASQSFPNAAYSNMSTRPPFAAKNGAACTTNVSGNGSSTQTKDRPDLAANVSNCPSYGADGTASAPKESFAETKDSSANSSICRNYGANDTTSSPKGSFAETKDGSDCGANSSIGKNDGADGTTKSAKVAEKLENSETEKELLKKADTFRRLMEAQRELARQKIRRVTVTRTDNVSARFSSEKTTVADKADAFIKLFEKSSAEWTLKQSEKIKGGPGDSQLADNGEQNSSKSTVNQERAAEPISQLQTEHLEEASLESKRKRRKKPRNSDSEEEDQTWGRVTTGLKTGKLPRRSSRTKRDVKYKSESDDDFQHMPQTKKARVEVQEADPSKHVPEAALAGSRHGCQEDTTHEEPLEKETDTLANYSSSSVGISMGSCGVPDAEFYNFDRGREEKDVQAGQVWALYDDKDGMPKYYMKVKEVLSRMPFKVSVGWYEVRKPSDEVCDLLDMGFSFPCGEFRIFSSQLMHNVNSFSHLVTWERGGKGTIKVYPKKGQIWCVYEEWRPGQELIEIRDTPPKFSMVEVLTDCHETSGVSVRFLKKVEGFKVVFKPIKDRVLEIVFVELLRFSHQVPACKLKGSEAPHLPKDCWEMDPAAIPSSLSA